jgi:two-component sensor histidine kinase
MALPGFWVYSFLQMKIYAILPLLMASVCITVAFYELLIWSRRRATRRDIAFAMTCLGGTLFCLACSGEYNVDFPAQSVPWLRIQAFSLQLTALAFLWFVSEETGLVRRSVLVAAIAVLGSLALAQAIGLGDLTWIRSQPQIKRVQLPFGSVVEYLEVESGPLTDFGSIAGIAFLLYLFWVANAYRRRAGWKEARSLFAVLAIVALSYLNDFAVNSGFYSFVFSMEYAWLAVIVLIGLKRSTEVLEAAVAKRALEQSETRLRAALEEKDLLLKEVHHRVKNNLQLISSLLFLQAARVAEPHFKSILQDCRNQITSMAVIHEELYRSQDFASIDFGAYLRGLVRRLLASFPARSVGFVPDIEDIRLGIDQAIPCGIIVNELCTNAIKHAYPPGFDGCKPEIRVELRALGDARASIVVWDNGVGLPEGYQLGRNSSLGMKIVANLVIQIEGEIYAENRGGARIEVVFPRK